MRQLALAGLMALTASIPTVPVLADQPPLAGAMPLSEIIAKLEQRSDFAYVREIDLDDGFYEVEFRTKDGRDIQLTIDPRSGTPR